MTQKRKIALLGSTGSIGTSALDLVRKFPERFHIQTLVAGKNAERLAEQILEFSPSFVATADEETLEKVRAILPSSHRDIPMDFGIQASEKAATFEGVNFVLSSIVGAAGLRPTLAAVRAGLTLGLANKESMVVAGALVSRAAHESGSAILPIDSEHSAIFQALQNSPEREVHRLILTASGGPFFPRPEVDLSKVKKEDALKHPNWTMGAKITIDSATMMNKGLEVIEAYWLFRVPLSKIEVIVHPQSIIHSMVDFVDGSILAQLGVPDMKGPIAYALSYPERIPGVMEHFQFEKMREFTFFKPDHDRFPAILLAREALEKGETYPAVLNGANEETVSAFLSDKISFSEITTINQEVVRSFKQKSAKHLEDFIEADRWGREKVQEMIRGKTLC